jgi:hypothetical protein
MKWHSITQDTLLKAAQALDGFFTRDQAVQLFFGKNCRHHGIERLLPYLTAKGRLFAYQYHKKLAYIVPRRAKKPGVEFRIEHGVGCSECKVRLWLADRTAQFVPERRFKGFTVWPDGGLIYPNGWLLMYEFSTQDNAKRLGVLRNKARHYLQLMKDTYQVLFVLDLPASKVADVVNKLPQHEAFWYTDFTTFQNVPLGQQLLAPIYINGGNGEILSLRADGH